MKAENTIREVKDLNVQEEIEKYIELAKFANEERIEMLETDETENGLLRTLLFWMAFFILIASGLAIR